ncbi:hypothetical protein FV139_14980 [Parahaliea maris]|uniref:Uncharacterized protein n=1 Tax=Parahaliea maris TaxID=2716870 RepID=A0A5C8ZX19_9GAMM|nr:hypothetical protein [Parahaliea maris]TXS92027.1 hypothetical protein FV139_14980 [Parahaliea maris]
MSDGTPAPSASHPRPLRGERRTGKIDLSSIDWPRNEFNVGMLSLSADPVTGAETFALNCPDNFVYPEDAHFYDCEEELYQFSGEFHHDEIDPYYKDTYVYRPIGTVYGHGEGSHDGGIIIASLARERRRFHFQEHPEPWTGHYLVDQLWNPRPVSPAIVNAQDLPWVNDEVNASCQVKLLRGAPGKLSQFSGVSDHSPWAAESAFILRVPAGYSGSFPSWPGFVLELLVIAGQATIDGDSWHRGCYGFDPQLGECTVQEPLEIYVRAFADY